MPKVLISDYDKTYYTDDKSIKLNNQYVETFRDKGNFFIIATGRSYYDFKKVKDKYRINYDYLFINHGATILDNKNNIIYNFPIENKIIKSLKKDLELANSTNNFYCSCLESRVPSTHKNITKLNITYKDDDTATRINNFINTNYFKYLKSYHISNNKIEIVSYQASKLNSINLLIKEKKLNKNNIYTIGDGESDSEMIKEFNGACMKDSIPKLKELTSKEYNNVSDFIKDIMAN